MSISTLDKGRAIAETLNPDLERTLEQRYDDIVPGFAQTLIEFAYGRLYSRKGLDMKTRQIATVAALTVLGGQTAPQLKINIEHALATGATKQEISEVILQMSAYGGLPAAINGLNAAKEVFASQA